MTHNDRLMRSALRLAASGMFVFPLQPGRKTPALTQNWEGRATTDAEQIERWWVTAPNNIGVATGPSQLLVLDLDARRSHGKTGGLDGWQVLQELAHSLGETVPRDTFSVATAGGGLHVYFRAPAEPLSNSAGRIGPHVDTRASGGYVVGPGSTVNRRRYRVVRDSVPADAPDWIVEALRTTTTRRADPLLAAVGMRRHTAYVDAAVEGEIRNVGDAAVGRRNHTLFVAAARLARFVADGQLSAHDVRTALEGAAAEHVGIVGFTSDEVRRTIESGLRRGTAAPSAYRAVGPQQAASARR